MIVSTHLSLEKILQNTWDKVLFMLAISLFVTFANQIYGLKFLALTITPTGILGTALAILLGFRNNAAYDRWWEARKLWGGFLNESRTTARQILYFLHARTKETDELYALQDLQKRFIYRQIGFNYAMAYHLRRENPFTQLAKFLDDAELESLRNAAHLPNMLIKNQSAELNEALSRGWISEYHHVKMEERLALITIDMGGCDRIKNTVFPRQYSYYTSIFVWIFAAILPFGLVGELGYLTVPATLLIGYIFFVLESVGQLIENPFENEINDTPMLAISRNAEINLREMLGESDLPPQLASVDGFLY